MWLLAEEVTTISGGGLAGWSTFGLAGLILAWLFLKHLPDKDRQIKEMLADHKSTMEDKDKQIERVLLAKNEQIKLLTESGTAQIKTMLDSGSAQARLLYEQNERVTQRLHEENQRALGQVIKYCEDEAKSNNQLLQYHLEQMSSSIDELVTEVRSSEHQHYSNPTKQRLERKHQPPDNGGQQT